MNYDFSVPIQKHWSVSLPSVFDIGRHNTQNFPDIWYRYSDMPSSYNVSTCIMYYSDLYNALLWCSISWHTLSYTVGCYQCTNHESQTTNHDHCIYIRIFFHVDRAMRKNCNYTVFYKHAQWKPKLASLNSPVLTAIQYPDLY